MGRIKTALVRRLTKEVLRKHGDQLGTDFAKNKEVLNEISNMPSKKIRNIVAGYMTRTKRMEAAKA